MNSPLYKFTNSFLLATILLACPITYAGDYIEDETTSPKSVEDSDDSITYGLEPKEKKLPKLGSLIRNLPPFLQDASLTPHFRTYSFSRNTEDTSDPDAITLGGEIRFLSGIIKQTFRLGASYYISHGIHDNDGEGTLLLGSDGSDINTLGKLYLDIAIDDAFLRLYRQTFDLPYLNKQDSRMIPNTHEAYVLAQDGADIDFIVGHVSQIKQRNAEGFISMAEAAGAEGSGKGLSMAGARYHLGNDSSIGAINYYTKDVINIFYSEFNFKKNVTEEISAKITGQFSHQKSIGDNLIGEFDTNHYGIQVKTGYRNAILTLAATNTGSGANIQSPFGGRPGFLSLMIQDFDRANEQGLLAGLSYNFSRWGIPGLSSFAKFAWGNNAKDANSGQNLPDLSEYDLTIDYKPETNLLNGLWLRLRHARADFEGGDYTKDTRVIFNYELPLH